MRVDVLTLFPPAFNGPLDVSIIKRARDAGLLDLHVHDIREHATDRHRSVDDYPFGGGQGMVLRVDVLDAALQHVRAQAESAGYVIYLSPQGERLHDRLVRELAGHERLILVCGRYEGVDERFVEHCVDREVSIGDYVLTGGELPAMVLIDAVARHIPGALGDEASSAEESFAGGLLEHPQYTRPAEYRGWQVPEVLLGGHHAQIERWKQEQRLERTGTRRPDLLTPANALLPPLKKPKRLKGFTIRGANFPAEFEAIRALWERAGPGIQLRPSDSEAELAKKIERDPDLFLVADWRERIVGAVLGGFDGRRGFVYHLASDPAHRGSGIAQALMAELEARLRAKGCIRMNLQVTRNNFEAMTFYERQGWLRLDTYTYGKDLA